VIVSTDDKHHGAHRALDKMQDAAAAVVGKASAALGGAATAPFVRNAALSDLFAIQAAEIAKQRARSRKVSALADKLAANHRMTSCLLFAALGRSAVAEDDELPPAELDSRRHSLIDHLNATPDEHFNRTYIEQRLAAHEETRTLLEAYADDGDDPHLRAHALSVLPGVDAHIRSIAAIQAAED
jgi:putative membrane protein